MDPSPRHRRSDSKIHGHHGPRRTREEERALRELARERRPTEGRRRRARRPHEEDAEEAGFEPLRRASQRRPPEVRDLRTEPPLPEGEIALVVGLARGRALVELPEGRLDLPLAARAAGLAVGDRVRVERHGGRPARVLAAEPRRSQLSRPDPSGGGRELVLAANVDLGVVVLSAARVSTGLADRFLLRLRRGGSEAALCVHKVDLLEEPDQRAALVRLLEPYRALGYRTLFTSVEGGEGLAELASLLSGRVSVLVGQSGVGKSSLLNALDPEGRRAVQEVRERDGKGKHTTTSASLRRLPGGGAVIDTPGIRQLALGRLEIEELLEGFPEIAARTRDCRFADCRHGAEPGCALRAAREAGLLPAARLDSFLRLLAELEGGG